MNRKYMPNNVVVRATGGIRYADGDRAICEICGTDWLSLQAHVWQTHGLLADEYRIKYGIPHTTPLLSVTTRERVRSANSTPQRIQRFMLVRTDHTDEEVRRKSIATTLARSRAGLHKGVGEQPVTVSCQVCGVNVLTWHSDQRRTCYDSKCVAEIKRRIALENRVKAMEAMENSATMRAERDARLRDLARTLGPARRKPHLCSAGCGTVIPLGTRRTCSPECRREVRVRTQLLGAATRKAKRAR